MRIDELFTTTVPGRRIWKKRAGRVEKVVVPASTHSVTLCDKIETTDD